MVEWLHCSLHVRMWLSLSVCVWGDNICMVFVYYRLKACEQRRSELFEKQGRGQRFTTMKERDAWIKSVCFTKLLFEKHGALLFVINSLGS